jgi:hypothetical protein
MKPAAPEEIADILRLCASTGASAREIETVERQIRAFLRRDSRSPDRDDGLGAASLRRGLFNPYSRSIKTMNTQPRSGWQDTVDQSGGIEGDPVRFSAKTGLYTVDGVSLAQGYRAILFMPTARHCGILWSEDHKVLGRTQVHLYDDAAPGSDDYPAGYKPSTTITCVSTDESHRLMTLMFTVWGARTAFARLGSAYLARGARQFPICILGSKPKKNDPYGNFNPILDPVSWVSRGDFPHLSAPPLALETSVDENVADIEPGEQAPTAPVDEDTITSGYAGRHPLDDDIPFACEWR